MQCEQGALHTYREAQTNLGKLTVRRRPVNNHNKIKEITNQVGASLGRENLNPIGQDDCAPAAEEVIV